jgi:hypothetical protein
MPNPLDHYDASMVYPIQWGKLAQLPDGHWQTTWELELEALAVDRLDRVAAAAADPAAGFSATLTTHGQNRLVLALDTVRWGMEDDYYALTYRAFGLIDAQVGRIRTIQGCPRDWYRPFRA